MKSVLSRDAAVSSVIATVLLVALTVTTVVAISAGVVMEIAGGWGREVDEYPRVAV